jgi:hypothetical protein
MVSVARKLSTIEERAKNNIVSFGEEITITKATNPKSALGSSLSEYVGCRDNNDNFVL